MRKLNALAAVGLFVFLLSTALVASAAYQHAGDADKDPAVFLTVYPNTAGTKLDNCATCHTGGSETIGGKTTDYGSCQWCHYKYGYNAPHGDIQVTLNPYGKAYNDAGRYPTDPVKSADSLSAIDSYDSDGDGYSNKVEIDAIRYPGNALDDPSKVTAPYRVFSRAQLEAMSQYSEFLLMNASKSTDFYAQYSGVLVSDLLNTAGMLPSSTGIDAIAPDGFEQYHPLHPATGSYHVFEPYPYSQFYYNEQADIAKNLSTGWCDDSAPSVQGKNPGDKITGLRMLLAIKRDGAYLTPGELNPQNKLDGEGPYRAVLPKLLRVHPISAPLLRMRPPNGVGLAVQKQRRPQCWCFYAFDNDHQGRQAADRQAADRNNRHRHKGSRLELCGQRTDRRIWKYQSSAQHHG